MTAAMTINFSDIEGPVYSGRPRGQSLRARYHLDEADKSAELVTVEVPEGTYSVTSSFFLGFFGPSGVKAGSEEAFFKKFRFHAPPVLMDAFADYASRALQTKNLFSIS